MRRALSMVLSLIVLFAVLAVPASARWEFCSTDPIFDVGGKQVSVLVELAPYELKDEITEENPVYTVLAAPRGTNPRVIEVSGDFPEKAIAREWNRPLVGVVVRVPPLDDFQRLRVTVSVDGRVVRQVDSSARVAVVAFPWR